VATTNKQAGEGATTYLHVEQAVRRAEELLCDQWTSRQIVEKLCKEFDIVERTAYTRIRIAYENLSADAANDRGIRKARARATWQTHYRRCIERGDMSAANYAMDRLCRLDGLFAPEKVEHSGTISVAVQIDAVINVLDTAGLAALEIVMAQVEAAKQSGLLIDVPDEPTEDSTLPAGEEGDALLARDGVAVPIPAKRRGRAPRGKKS
jgi:hypothetical protein